MKFPKLSRPSLHRALMQNFSGGINTNLPPHLIETNEQAEVYNMFFNNGVLQKRPSFQKALDIDGYIVSDVKTDDGLFIYKYEIDEYGRGFFNGAFIKEDGSFYETNEITIKPEYEFSELEKEKLCYCFFPFSANGTLYLSAGYKSENDEFLGKIFKYSNSAFTEISDEEIYAPLVIINAKGNKFSSLPISDNAVFTPQIPFEGLNLLTKRIRVSYTTDGSSFSFPFLIERKPDTKIKVKLIGSFTENANIEEYSFTIDNDSHIAKLPGGISCFVSNLNSITFRLSDNTAAPPTAAAFSNNLEVEYYITENPNAKSFFEMSIFTPFGATKYSGGNRLFVAGNKDEKNLLRWSDVNNALYFPENNYAYVSDGQIMSLKKQGNMLVIFSKDEIHYTTYLSNSYTSDDFISGAVTDITAVSALFPITQLHSELGIYDKNAAYLMDNKIIFLGSDKKLYRIDSTNKITHISKKVDKFLKENNPQNIAAGRYLNYFLLATNLGIIAFNTETGGFYVWNDQIAARAFLTKEDKPVIVTNNAVYLLNEDEKFDFGFTTLTTDLYYPDKFKKLCKIIVIGDGGEISVIADNQIEITRKIKKYGTIYLNIPKAKNFKFKLKNCNNLEGIIFYYTLY